MQVTWIKSLKTNEPAKEALKIQLDDSSENFVLKSDSFIRLSDCFLTVIFNRSSLIFDRNASNM